MAEQLKTTEQLKANVRRVFEALNEGDLTLVDELASPNIVVHHSPRPDIKGVAAFKQSLAGLLSALPDFHYTIDELIAEGNTIAVRGTYQGTHKGPLPSMPIPPTGKQVTVTGCAVYDVVDGKVVEMWEYLDLLGLMQQLGVVPARPPA